MDIQMQERLRERYKKKCNNDPGPLRLLELRAFNSAIAILDLLHGIDFSKVTTSLFFYTKDIKMQDMTREYEAEIELAAIDPEKFAFGLHKFYTKMEKKIRKQDLYSEFFELHSKCFRLNVSLREAETLESDEDIRTNVSLAFINLLMQQTDYLRPSKFDLNVRVYGRKTTGEILTITDPIASLDSAELLFEEMAESGKYRSINEMLTIAYGKYGYDVHDIEDVRMLTEQDKIQATTIAVLLPYINEYTADMAPHDLLNPAIPEVRKISTTLTYGDIQRDLRIRNKMLTTNGLLVTFPKSFAIKEIHHKELLYDDSVVMLYRLVTADGDMSGMFDPKSGYLYNCSLSANIEALTNAICSLVLFCYACFVKMDTKYNLSELGNHFHIDGEQDIIAEGFLRGGRLKTALNDEVSTRSRTLRIGNDDFTKEERAIQGYIRRLPNGQKASEEAKSYAERLGYQLAPNETYVRPFVKEVFKLSVRENTMST